MHASTKGDFVSIASFDFLSPVDRVSESVFRVSIVTNSHSAALASLSDCLSADCLRAVFSRVSVLLLPHFEHAELQLPDLLLKTSDLLVLLLGAIDRLAKCSA